MPDLNVIALTGNLTQDAILRGENQNVLAIRLAVSGQRKVGDNYEDTSHFFDVTLFGRAGEGNRAQALAPYLKRGSRIAVQGRLDWQSWEQDDQKRQAVQVIADDLVLLGGPREQASPS